MIKKWSIYFVFAFAIFIVKYTYAQELERISFIKEPFLFQKEKISKPQLSDSITAEEIASFSTLVNNEDLDALIQQLVTFKTKNHLNDWLYYHLIRRVSESISPKAENYHSYTLYKWLLMNKSGYDARIALGKNQIIFYIKNKEDISDIPYFNIDHQQFTCLNYHDYGKLFSKANTYIPVNIYFKEGFHDFKYKIEQMPEFTDYTVQNKNVNFEYKNQVYHFDFKVNKELATVFKNYPGVDFESYFNIPMTKETYQSLIPILKKNIAHLSTVDGVDYLMRFTRYAFLYESDDVNFNTEKRLSPEMTLLNQYSDCDDRVALFFYLTKEIYNLPMVAILYPTHITMGVQFDQKIGTAIKFEDNYYSICEPTPQEENLKIGQLAEKYQHENYKIVYHYQPK